MMQSGGSSSSSSSAAVVIGSAQGVPSTTAVPPAMTRSNEGVVGNGATADFPWSRLQHPVAVLRILLATLLFLGYLLPAYSTRNVVAEACLEFVDEVATTWEPVWKGALLFLIADGLGCLVFQRRNRGCRWWGRREKFVVRGTLGILWLYCIYATYVYCSGIATSRFRCWSGPMAMTVLGFWVFAMYVPLWYIFLEEDTSTSGRYLAQDSLDDELDDLEESPVTYQVWRRGRLLFTSLSRAEVKRWLAPGGKKSPPIQEHDFADTVVREVRL
ncbi:unnamed protein product [Amoebophrya sp. A25]|nr:unnamed protein product [Amoebophrya sp. A25]|eukprot:GSA25T00015304001.1